MQFFNSKIFTFNISCIDNQGLCRELVHWEKLWYNYFFLILRYKYRKIKQNLRLTTCIPMNYYYMLSNIYHVNWIQIQKIHKYLCWLHQVWYFSRFFSRKEQRTRLWAPLPLLCPWQRCRIYWSPSGMLSGFVQLDKNETKEKILKWSND